MARTFKHGLLPATVLGIIFVIQRYVMPWIMSWAGDQIGASMKGHGLSKSFENRSITLETASALIDAVLGFAAQARFEASIAVVDPSGILRAFRRTDGAPFLTVDLAINKAWTAASLGYPTRFWNDHIAHPAFAPMANLPRVVAVAGGYPLRDDGRVIGAIGVSGGTSEQDCSAAEWAIGSVGFAT